MSRGGQLAGMGMPVPETEWGPRHRGGETALTGPHP
jgi:hypothetical protein